MRNGVGEKGAAKEISKVMKPLHNRMSFNTIEAGRCQMVEIGMLTLYAKTGIRMAAGGVEMNKIRNGARYAHNSSLPLNLEG
jgi:hypothetical protein